MNYGDGNLLQAILPKTGKLLYKLQIELRLSLEALEGFKAIETHCASLHTLIIPIIGLGVEIVRRIEVFSLQTCKSDVLPAELFIMRSTCIEATFDINWEPEMFYNVQSTRLRYLLEK